MTITPFYASLAAILFVVLSFRVIRARRAFHVALGDGENQALRRRLRAHGNFAEYGPFALLLMALAELQGAPGWNVHLLGLLLLGGRMVHAYGLSREPEPIRLRVLGMSLTFIAVIGGAVTNLGLLLATSLR